ASTISSAVDLVKGMIGVNGLALPASLLDGPGLLARAMHRINVVPAAITIVDFGKIALWIIILLFIALALPNTLEILARYEPALGVKPKPIKSAIGAAAQWNASLPWAIAISAIAMVAMASIGGPSEFLYWQF